MAFSSSHQARPGEPVATEDAGPAAAAQAPGDLRRRPWDRWRAAVTNGAPGVTSGERLAAVFMLLMYAVVTTLNIATKWHEQPELPKWEPAVWEYSSAMAAWPALLVPWLTQRLAPPGPPWLRFVPAHLLGSVTYAAVHVAGFLILRHAVYALVGERYEFGGDGNPLLYEYGKDSLGYAGAVALFWLLPRLLRPAPDAAAQPAPAVTAGPEPVFEVRDGSRVLRAPHREIVAVTSAGNYVEVLMADGGRPLTRMTLAQAETELAPSGFLRVHRSWLVNAARVRALTPEGSGDYALELDGGVIAPLSRRFPDALAQLRRG